MLLLPLTLAAVVMSGCAAPPAPEQVAPSPAPSTEEPPAEPDGLIGLWRVSAAEGETPETWLRLDAGAFQLWRDCGMITGSWAADAGVLLATVFGADGACAVGRVMPGIPWLEAASTYEATADGWILRDRDGGVAASLTVDGAPEPIPTAAEFYAEPPVIDERGLAWLAGPGPLPDGLVPASSADLEGRWAPRGMTEPHAIFSADGTWTGSDGCNGGSGRWAVGSGGRLITTSGPMTLIGCDGAAVPGWVGMARLVGFEDGDLVLLDGDGVELGRLVRG